MISTHITRRVLICAGLLVLLYSACSPPVDDGSLVKQAKMEILQVEADFASVAQETSVKEAFLTYAADSAVLNRSGELVRGKIGIEEYFDSWTFLDVDLKWSPDFVDASSSGDMGYTYGNFELQAIDSSKEVISAKGVFHTVWKKMDDGSWKFVYD